MIDHARKLQYTPGHQTVVHFFDSEKFTPDNSLQTKFEAGMWLDTPTFTNEYRQHRFFNSGRSLLRVGIIQIGRAHV